ncbi:MAG TPA: hypothetical protein VM143_04655 [Acidimicrobiales bacterium]|nr:hypothetical protein [Acidimicrobiales bacterium]
MRPRLALALVLFAVVATSAARAAEAQDSSTSSMHHAAVVIDTGDGQVRKMCLAFPEDEISGIEALRRLDTRPNRFEPYGSKGLAVCMLCGVGCSTGACFCDPARYWAYHRAGPGEATYQPSRAGASSTVVRDGDVEAWKWGSGDPPEKTTVGQTCNVPEPPARTSSATTTTSEATSPATEASQSPTTTNPAPSPTSPQASTPAVGGPTPKGAPATVPPAEARLAAAGEEAASPSSATDDEAAFNSAAEVKRNLGAQGGGAADPRRKGTTVLDKATTAVFAATLGGILFWRSRLRRANVRRGRPVR